MPNVIVGLPAGTSPIYGNFYRPVNHPNGYTYRLVSSTTGPGLVISTTNFSACEAACS